MTEPVDTDALELDDEGRASLGGAPFSGVAVERDDEGRLRAEETWHEGLRHGPARLFHPSGALAEEGRRHRGAWHGLVEVWNDDGSQAEEARYAFGICLEQLCWDADGEVVEHFQLDPDSDMMRLVEQCRADDPAGAAAEAAGDAEGA